VRDTVSYEGQAAIELEQLAGQTDGEPWPWRFGASDELVARCAEELGRGRDRGMISADFHETVAEAAAVACLEAAGPELVVLSGGTFQNVRLLASITWRLERYGFRVLSHRRVPPNDAGISFGQAAVAVARARAE
jgi:hydrogenase maturation protein HypF